MKMPYRLNFSNKGGKIIKKFYALVIVIFLLLVSPSIVFCQSPKGAIQALKKVESRTEVGISYKDYSPVLGDAQYRVKMFLGSPEAKAKPALTKSVRKVMEHYITAKVVWDLKFFYSGLAGEIIYVNSNDPRNKLIATITESYPEVTNAKRMSGEDEVLLVDEVVRIIWDAASRELKKATFLFSKSK